MSFISRNNFVTLEDIDLETNLIGVLLNNKCVTYSWGGGCWFRMDYSPFTNSFVYMWSDDNDTAMSSCH